MNLPQCVFHKIGEVLIYQKFGESFCNLAICSKYLLNTFSNDNDLFTLYIQKSMDTKMYLKVVLDNLYSFQYKRITQTNLVAVLKEFESRLKHQDIDDAFILENNEMLSSIKFELEYILKEPNIRKNNGVLIGFRDRIFRNLLKSIKVINERKMVSDLFDEFIKGITYFSNQQRYNVIQPAYHRESSCSRKGTPNKKCTSQDRKDSLDIERCFIERLIYDELWNHMMSSQQDIDHLNWLQDTKNAFKSCFPDTDIAVVLTRFHDNFPICVEIFKKTGSKVKTERYTHLRDMSNSKYLDLVSVYKEYNGNISTGTNTFDTKGSLAVLYGGKKSKC